MVTLLKAAGAGLVCGVLARALMRLVTLMKSDDLAFSPGASAMIVGLFVIAAVSAYFGALLARRIRWLGLLVVLVGLVPLWVPGLSIAMVEVTEGIKGQGGSVLVGVILAALAIVSMMVAAPLTGWRLGRRFTDGMVEPGRFVG